jgi:hypothetical protein
VEDFIKLAVESEAALLTGDITFKSKIVIPPGEVNVLEKIYLEGDFNIKGARFPDPGIQEKVNALSRTGKGSSPEEDPSYVEADLKGRFVFQDAEMDFGSLSFAVPGAEVALVGNYRIPDENLDFQGELLLDAKISETQSGFKSFLLKIVDPLFSRKGYGAVIPIRISGSPKQPVFGVEKGRIFSRKTVAVED